ncbi:hypothetical protein GGR56DRAFT_636285 [Xylariaceae sp. FL0804]|nr:hypothetical protein GGR56DRAFT_636285 [Xylariaceae sp. FL0804]
MPGCPPPAEKKSHRTTAPTAGRAGRDRLRNAGRPSFQEVEELRALQSSIRFVPHPIMGAATKPGDCLPDLARQDPTLGQSLGAGHADRAGSGGHGQTWRELLARAVFGRCSSRRPPMNPDVLFTASNLVSADAFPAGLQPLAGGVFNEVAQFGNSVDLAAAAAIAASVTEHSEESDRAAASMEGYQAAFGAIFAATVIVVPVSFFGFRNSGKVGQKRNLELRRLSVDVTDRSMAHLWAVKRWVFFGSS